MTGLSFQTVYQCRHRDLGRIVHQQVNVVIFTIELNQFGLEVGKHASEDVSQVIDHFFRAGHARLVCQVNGEVMPSATGTHRSYSALLG